MPNNQNDNLINNLLNLIDSRIHWRKHQKVVHGSGGKRIIDENTDDTGVGNNNETENLAVDNIYMLDCGHVNLDNLGGECHFCDAIVCKDCISICSNCGHSICPNHTKIANFFGTEKPYCRSCAQEILRDIKLGIIKKTISSFFISSSEE